MAEAETEADIDADAETINKHEAMILPDEYKQSMLVY